MRLDLLDVVFSSGMECLGPTVRLHARTSDAAALWVKITYPFDALKAASLLRRRTAPSLNEVRRSLPICAEDVTVRHGKT